MSRAIDLAWRAKRSVLRLLRWPTRGVKALVFDAGGRVLLIRNRYGDTGAFVLPGGGVKWREAPIDAAAREVREETGCIVTDLLPVATFRSRAEGKRDTIHLFRGLTANAPVADGLEVSEARFVALDALPPTTSPATRRRIEEHRGTREPDGRW